MELEQITMDRNDARKAFLEYRHAVRERHDQEDEQIMRGYRALAQGRQLINLPQTLRTGGSEIKAFRNQEFHVPRLAVARADAKLCFTTGVDSQGGCVMTADKHQQDLAPNNRRDTFRAPAGTFEPGKWASRWSSALKAIVPNVPPPFRPAHSLAGYLILWEAEWHLHPVPPVDPALLKHIGGDLYAVCAIWDLTELERAVLAGR